MNAVFVPEPVSDRVFRYAADAYPHECCGALIGEGSRIVEAFELPNTTAEGPRRRFLIGPDDYRRAEVHASQAGKSLVGFYHSHPDHAARPSSYDLDHAWPSLVYVIVAVDAGRPAAMTAWRLSEGRTDFDELDLRLG